MINRDEIQGLAIGLAINQAKGDTATYDRLADTVEPDQWPEVAEAQAELGIVIWRICMPLSQHAPAIVLDPAAHTDNQLIEGHLGNVLFIKPAMAQLFTPTLARVACITTGSLISSIAEACAVSNGGSAIDLLTQILLDPSEAGIRYSFEQLVRGHL